jgi:hypothetical protein
MGPMLVAMLAVLFFAFAILSACVAVIVAVLGFRRLLARSSRFFGIYVLGSGIVGAAAALLAGVVMRWNVVGDAIMQNKILGCLAWGVIGFGWSAAAAFLIGSLVRRWFCRGGNG